MADCKKDSLFPVPMEKAEKLVGRAEDEEQGGINPNSSIDVDEFFAISVGCFR